METKIASTFPDDLEFKFYNFGLRDLGKVGPAIEAVSEELNQSKSQLDDINVPDKESLLSVFNYLQDMRREIANRVGDSRSRDHMKVNNSFLKGIEILAKYKILERYENVVLLDTAGIPGYYIYAVNYYLHHIVSPPKSLTWFGCYDDRNRYQNDNFRIKQKCHRKWLAHEDFTKLSVINGIVQQTVRHGINLAISDLAIDTSENYDDQEIAYMKYVIAQLIIDISSIRTGGSVVIKQFSCFHPFAISYIYALSGMFDEFYVYKPIASKPQNSEIFMVCIGFRFPGTECKHDDETCCAQHRCRLVRSFISVMRDALYSGRYAPFVAKEILIPFLEQVKPLYFQLATEQMMCLEKIYFMIRDVSAQSRDIDRVALTETYRKEETGTILAKVEAFYNIVNHRFPDRVNTFQKIYD